MNFLGLVIGFILGWILEWIIDWLYWRRQLALLKTELATSQTQTQELTVRLAQAEQERQRLQAQLAALQMVHDQAELGVADLRAQLSEAQAAHRKTEAMVTELQTQLTAAQAAQSLADKNREELSAPLQQTIEQLRAQLAEAEARHQQALQDCQAEVTALQTPAKLVRLRTPKQQQPVQKDPLIDITGIGPVYERRLYRAGIYTFAQLAALTPRRIQDIIKPEEWQKFEPKVWIAEAKVFLKKARGKR